jgi:hypothetical protein
MTLMAATKYYGYARSISHAFLRNLNEHNIYVYSYTQQIKFMRKFFEIFPSFLPDRFRTIDMNVGRPDQKTGIAHTELETSIEKPSNPG